MAINPQQELKTVTFMIKLYYKKNCDNEISCSELLDYVTLRQSKCPFKTTKTFCSACSVHCYKDIYRAQIKKVMKYSGPRMILYHPILAVKHVYYMKKENKKNGKQTK